MTVIIASLFGLSILLFELLRPKHNSIFDYLRAVNVIFLLAWVVVPIFIVGFQIDQFDADIPSWLLEHNFQDPNFTLAILCSILAYLSIISGYYINLGSSRKGRIGVSTALEFYRGSRGETYLFYSGLVLLIFGTIALIIYSRSLGGVLPMLIYSGALRSNSAPIASTMPYLKNLMALNMAASYLIFASMPLGKARLQVKWALVVAVLFSLITLFHQAGRLNLASYIASFLIAIMMKRGRASVSTLSIGLIGFLGLIYFGKQLFHSLQVVDDLSRRAEDLKNGGSLIRQLLFEISFPFVNVSHAIVNDANIQTRYFQDLLLGAVYLLPDRLLNIELPPTLSFINTSFFGTKGEIPLDMVSYGVYSMGLIGIIIVGWVNGMAGRLFECAFCREDGGKLQIVGVVMLLWLAYRIIYGDQSNVWSTGYHLFIMLVSTLR